MAFIAQDTGGGDFKRVPAGVHIGRCYSLIDLGTQKVDFQGDIKNQHKILVRWELFGEDEDGAPLTIDIDGQTRPMTISKRYTLSLSNKARLRQDLESWRGRSFTDEEAKGFDVSKLLGAYCLVNVTHNDTNGKTYSNVASLTPLPGAMKHAKPEPVHANQIFDLDNPDMDLFGSFHEKLQDTIRESAEWLAHHGKYQAKSGGNSYEAAKNGDLAAGNREASLAGGDGFDNDPPF